MQCVFMISNSPNGKNKAGFIIFHPERNNLVSKFCPLTTYMWKCISHISDFGLIYVSPRTKRKFKLESGHIYIIGGYDNKKKKFLRSILRYNILRGEWFHCKKMQIRRACFQPFLFDGKIFCAGGYTSKTLLTDSVECYEPLLDVVEMSESLPLPCAGYGCAYLRNNVFIIGGNVLNKNGFAALSSHLWSFESFEKPVSETSPTNEIIHHFVNIEKAKVPIENGIIGHNILICETNSRIYIIGGTNNNTEVKSAVAGIYYADIASIMLCKESKDEQQIIWSKRSIPEMQRSFNGVALINNKIFTIGGLCNTLKSTNTIMEVDEEDTGDFDQIYLRKFKNLEEHGIGFLKHSGKSLDMNEALVNERIGYFDWRRKIYKDLFCLRNVEDLDLENVHCAVVDIHEKFAEFNKDRFDWLLQWSLW